MRNSIKRTLCALLCIAIIGSTGCTTTTTVAAKPGMVAGLNLEAGDRLELVHQDLSRTTLTVTSHDDVSVSGTDESGETVVAMYDDLRTIKITKFDGKKTAKNAGIGVGAVVVGAAVIAGAAVAGMALLLGGG